MFRRNSITSSATNSNWLPLMAFAVALAGATASIAVNAALSDYADPEKPALPASDMVLDVSRAALVVIDPQIDFLSPDGVTWGVVGESVTVHGTVDNIEKLFKTVKE